MGEERHGVRVLVVDDDEAIRFYLGEVLRGAGCRVLTASDGLEAVEILGASPVDLLITDYNMPRMSGLELMRWCQAVLPRVPIVLISGQDPESLPVKGEKRGALRVLQKPLSDEHLLLVVGELCGAGLPVSPSIRKSSAAPATGRD
jgi:CheY-like chemotaxis protein